MNNSDWMRAYQENSPELETSRVTRRIFDALIDSELFVVEYSSTAHQRRMHFWLQGDEDIELVRLVVHIERGRAGEKKGAWIVKHSAWPESLRDDFRHNFGFRPGMGHQMVKWASESSENEAKLIAWLLEKAGHDDSWYTMRVTEFFRNAIGVPLTNSIWSWGAYDGINNRVFLKVSRHHIDDDRNGWVRVYDPDWIESNGHQERREHLNLVEKGADCYALVRSSGEDFDREEFLVLGKPRKRGNAWFAKRKTQSRFYPL